MTRSNIATRNEAEFLKENRRPPDPQLTLTPGGGLQFRVDYDMHRMRERRISFIENRLKMASAGMNRDRGKAISRNQ
jgi:hypothetical protein